MIPQPTPYPEVNRLLRALFERLRAVLGSRITGMYLEGSLASSGFDPDSDIDFVLVTEDELTPDHFSALQAMHEQIAALDTPWAIQLEGSYLPRHAVRRYDPAHTLYPNIERGPGERLKLANHDQTWDIHRHILRERGITLSGPPAHTLVDPVTPGQLRQAMQVILSQWASRILANPAVIKDRGYQSYTALSLCRILYTLEFGAVASKPRAAAWAQADLDERWRPLIERAWEGRHNPAAAAAPQDVEGTLDFIRYTLDRARRSPRAENP